MRRIRVLEYGMMYLASGYISLASHHVALFFHLTGEHASRKKPEHISTRRIKQLGTQTQHAVTPKTPRDPNPEADLSFEPLPCFLPNLGSSNPMP